MLELIDSIPDILIIIANILVVVLVSMVAKRLKDVERMLLNVMQYIVLTDSEAEKNV